MLANTSFGDVLWFIIIAYLFIAYLTVFFTVLVDLFRDHETSGVLKFVWILFLIFFPLIALLVYLLTRGRGMAARASAQQMQQKEAFDSYVRSAAGTGGAASELASAKSLLDSGAITQAEFDTLKAKLLS